MEYIGTVRPIHELEQKLRAGEPLNIPDECKHNSDVIYEILTHAHLAIPTFENVSAEEKRYISDAMAYLLNPRNIIQEQVERDPEAPIRLRKKPESLYDGIHTDRKLRNEENLHISSEFYRCFDFVFNWIPGLREKVDPKGHAPFKIGFISWYLLDPSEIDLYNYSSEIIEK